MPTLTTPRRSTITWAALIGLVALALISWWIASRDTADRSTGFETRTMQAGVVEVQATPVTLNETGASFLLKLGTHTGDLNLDLAAGAQLRINQQSAAPATWQGPGPGGHHREGTLRFATPVPSGATVELRITGLTQEIAATWTAP